MWEPKDKYTDYSESIRNVFFFPGISHKLAAHVVRYINSLCTKLKADNIQNFLLQPVVYYLVKWCSLPYEDSTWELKEDVDQAKIEEFEQLQASRPDSRRLVKLCLIYSSVLAN